MRKQKYHFVCTAHATTKCSLTTWSNKAITETSIDTFNVTDS